MSHRFQILCIKTVKSPEGLKLSHIGGKNPLGETWSLTLEKANDFIKSGEMEFFITLEGKTYDFLVSGKGEGYLALASESKDFSLVYNLPGCP
ncbi:hypothetical protein D0X99_16655 [Algoriphagus lacus]|uniref:DUF3892 domain-containing protein n=1 Tax=Algoriphagus lacus TaxID=2056311 RepID=A0A418PNW5_9BACT|nr:hypothetical protein [Algoriphagus lacus]RIW13401.1 hypothetical protein D0X99_16655 [Algoriphagus lacus]